MMRATDDSYTVVNNLRPGEFIIFQYQTNDIVWEYSATEDAINTVHLPATFFQFDKQVHNTNQPPCRQGRVTALAVKPTQTVVVQDASQRIRFLEEVTDRLLVLRAPWQVIDVIAKGTPEYVLGGRENGDCVARVLPKNSEWLAVVSREGSLKFFPPLLDNTPY